MAVLENYFFRAAIFFMFFLSAQAHDLLVSDQLLQNFNLTSIAPADSNYVSAGYQLFSNYYYSDNLGEKRYWFNSVSDIEFCYQKGESKFGVKYNQYDNEFYYQNKRDELNKIDIRRFTQKTDFDYSYNFSNRFSIGSGLILTDKPGLKWAMKYDFGEVNSKFTGNLYSDKWLISYDVKSSQQSFTFDYLTLENKIEFNYSWLNCEFSHKRLFSDKQNSSFTNTINANGYDLKTNLYMSDYNFYIQGSFNQLDAAMFYGKERFAFIDHLRIWNIKSGFEYKLNQNHYLALGCNYVGTSIGNDSYLDIWPFTYWDIFLAYRTRIKQFDNKIYLPYIAYRSEFEFSLLNFKQHFNSKISYNQFYSNSSIVYKERYYTLFPLTGYTTSILRITPDIDGMFSISADLAVEISTRFSLSLQSSQLIPVDWNELFSMNKNSDADGGSSETNSGLLNNTAKEWGGNYLKIELLYFF